MQSQSNTRKKGKKKIIHLQMMEGDIYTYLEQ
jgi:hypothetical protein